MFLFFKTIIDVKCLAKKYAVNNVVIIPIPKVMAKPFTGPEPNANKIIAAINVVIFASNTVIFAFEYPVSKACITDFSVLILLLFSQILIHLHLLPFPPSE